MFSRLLAALKKRASHAVVGGVAALAATATTATLASTAAPAAVPTIYVRNVSALSNSAVANAIPAFQAAVDKDFAPLWHVRAKLKFIGSASAPRLAEVILIQNKLDIANALGYHELVNGVADAKVGYGTGLAYGYQWTVTFTHELFEMLVNPALSRTEQNQNDGSIWAGEDADPVEAEQYGYTRPGANGKPVLISDFITERWFGTPLVNEPFDFTRHVNAPLEVLHNGYAQYWDGESWQIIQKFQAGKFRPIY